MQAGKQRYQNTAAGSSLCAVETESEWKGKKIWERELEPPLPSLSFSRTSPGPQRPSLAPAAHSLAFHCSVPGTLSLPSPDFGCTGLRLNEGSCFWSHQAPTFSFPLELFTEHLPSVQHSGIDGEQA